MAWSRRLLDEGEDLVLETRPHWWFFAAPAAAVVASVALATAVASAGAHELLQLPFIALAVAAAAWLAARYVRWATSGLVLTSERLILVQGVSGRRSVELPLARVAGVRVRRHLLDRLLGTGAVIVTSAPDGDTRTLALLVRPAAVAEEIERCAEDVLTRHRGGTTPAPQPSLAAELEHLDELRRRGVLTDEEFRAGKARLLGRG